MKLHFICENVYIKRFIEINEQVSSDSIYVMIGPESKIFSHEKVITLPNLDKGSIVKKLKSLHKRIKILKNLIKYSDSVYFHYLTDFCCFLLLFYLKHKKTCWIVWGSDLYYKINYQIYDENTKKILKGLNIPTSLYNKKLKLLYKLSIKKLTHIGSLVDGDYNLVKENFKINSKRIIFFYANPINFQATILNKQKTDDSLKTVFLGNSGDPSNNHITILQELQKYKNIKIICPLSYGNKKYIEKVVEIGKELYGKNFIPLLEFQKPDEYLNLLNSIDIAIMNHTRQQAMGNIFLILYLGKKLYLNPINPLYNMLITNDLKIEKMDFNDFSIDFTPYPQEINEHNKRTTIELNSNEVSIIRNKNLYSNEKEVI